MKLRINPRVMLVASMLIFGTIAPFKRGIGVSSGELALYRAVMGAALLALFLLVTRQPIPIKKLKKEALLLLLSGAAMGVNWILLFEAIDRTSASLATLSYYFAPTLVTLACPILFRERLSVKQMICFVMSTLGIVLITGTAGGSKGTDLQGVLFGLGAAVFYATVILLNKYIKNVQGLHRTFLQFLSAIVVLIPYVAATGGVTLGALDCSGWINLLILGLFHTGFAYCLYFSSLKELPGQEAAILSYVDPLVAVMISTFLEEPLSPVQWAGGALILGFAVWNEIPSKKK
ncbi:MAG: EamA/RhaT family transporter [Ruminococcaceae bacterium]|nr:EamA/RhaT family transporter [Oscillospiraceae bacterium]